MLMAHSYRRLKSITDNRTYNILLKGSTCACRVCSKRSGRYDAYCGPRNDHHINRRYKTWKHNRKTKWKAR